MEYISNTLGNLIEQTAFMNLTVGNLIMIAVACVFLYLAIRHGFEPLLLVPIAFGMLLVNIYPDIMLVDPSVFDLPRCRSNDGFRTFDREPEKFPSRSCRSVWYLCCIFRRYGNGIFR